MPATSTSRGGTRARRGRRAVGALVVAVLAVACATVAPEPRGAEEPPTGRSATPPTPTPSSQVAPEAPVTLPAPPAATGSPQRRPNLLLIETDDMRWDDLRWMPNVRHLIQRRGLSFEDSFAPYPLCCPSRASLLTGQYAHNHGVASHEDPFGFAAFDDRTTIATVLQGAGYRTALVGKYLNGYGVQRLRASGKPSLSYVPPGWDRWLAGTEHAWGSGGPFRGGTYDYFNLVQNVDGRIVGSPGRYSTDVLGEQVREVIAGVGRGDAPWFVWWTPVAPHHGSPVEADDPATTRRSDGLTSSWVTPARPEWVKGRFDDRIRHGSGTPPTGSAEADVEDKPRYLRKLPELTAAERAAVAEVTRQRAESLYVLDGQVGRTIAQLSRTGELADTVIVFTSDNGYYLGEHRKRQGKINAHEPSLRVPLVMAGPGVPRGRRYDPVTTVDLAPTLAAYAGTRMPDADGLDLTGLITGGDRGWNRPVVTEGRMPEARYTARHRLGPGPLNTRGLRLGRWKLTRYATGEAELYDLARDPLELENLSRVERYAGVLAELKALYQQYRDCRGQECAAPLPQRFRVDAEQQRRLTQAQVRATREHFGG